MYSFCLFFVRIFVYIVFRFEIVGRENLAEEGGVVVCANHRSNWDPLFVALACRRPIHFMAKEELFESALGNWFFRAVHVFPVRRNANDMSAIKKALSIVKNGEVLGMFPEGTRGKDGHTANAKAGVTMIAIKAGGVVQPIAIKGKPRPFHRVRVVIAPPIQYDRKALGKLDHEDYNRMAGEVMAVIRKMYKEGEKV